MDLKARDKKGAVREILQHLVDHEVFSDETSKKIEKLIHKREAQGSTGIGKGLAIPHSKECAPITEVLAVFARSTSGIPFDAVDGGLVYIIFMVLSPVAMADKHLSIMKKIATLHRDDKTLKFLRTTPKVESVLEILKEIDENIK